MNNAVKIFGGLALLWYGVFRGASAMIVAVRSWRFNSIDIANRTVFIDLNMLVKNPLFIGMTLNSIVGDVYIQGKNVGGINTTLNYFLSGGHTHIVPVSVGLDLHDISDAAILNIQSGDIRTLTVAFDGKLYVGKSNIGIPVQVMLDYNDLF